MMMACITDVVFAASIAIAVATCLVVERVLR